MPVRSAMLAAVAMIGACRAQGDMPPENASNGVNVASPPSGPVIAPEQAMRRKDLLLAAIEARSAAATGADDREAQRALDNRRFEYRVRLGCGLGAPAMPEPAQSAAPPATAASKAAPPADAAPPTEAAGPPDATYDPERRRVNLSVPPDLSLDDPLVAGLAGERVEAAEGFWVRQPWLLTPACAGGPMGQREFGLVQFFTDQEPRTARRSGRPYDAAANLPEGTEAPPPGRWELVLRGRLRQHGDGRVILCRAPGPGARPVCLIAVELDEVVIEDIETGDQLAQWGRG